MNKVVFQAIYFLLIAAILAVNYYFWHRWWHTMQFRNNMQNGNCKLLSTDYISGMKSGWQQPPVFGQKWTDVPCKVQLQVATADGVQVPTEEHIWLHFTYEQNFFYWNIWKDSCHDLVKMQATHEALAEVQDANSAASADSFDCAFTLTSDNKLDTYDGVYEGKKEMLPHLVALFLEKAIGLSCLTLFPIPLILCATLKNLLCGAKARTIPEDPKEEVPYMLVAA